MKKIKLLLILLSLSSLQAQVKLYLDSNLRAAYEKKYKFSENLMCLPFVCDPFYEAFYKKADTAGLCGRFVFVDRNYRVRIRPGFDLPCWFEPRFSEGLCAVNINNKITFIDSNGKQAFQTALLACSPHKNKVLPFKNGRAKVYQGSQHIKHYYQVYYIDRNGNRIKEAVLVKVKTKDYIPVAVVNREEPLKPIFPELPKTFNKGKYPVEEAQAKRLLRTKPHRDNRLLVYFECGAYQLENMNLADTVFCNQFVFTDTLFNVKIGGGFKLPCAFEPEFSEGLCAVSVDSMLVYIDTAGHVKINTGLKACSKEQHKVSTFRNGIATLYQGDPYVKGLYTTSAINTKGERVRLLEYDDLELAELKIHLFSNLSQTEAMNCFVGRGKSNGLWFLIEKSGKVLKKLELKPQ